MRTIKVSDNKWAVIAGYVEYHAGRDYPWLGQHGGVVSYFATEAEATRFAQTGKL